jgi:hypothetical protein
MKKLTVTQTGIILTAIATGLIHLVLLNLLLVQAGFSVSVLFVLNGIGFLVLTSAYFLPQLKAQHNLIRWAFVGYTMLTIIAWIPSGERGPLGLFTKLIEVALIIFLFRDRS